jgi:hypothetical protein
MLIQALFDLLDKSFVKVGDRVRVKSGLFSDVRGVVYEIHGDTVQVRDDKTGNGYGIHKDDLIKELSVENGG